MAHGARGGLRGVTGDFPVQFRFAGAVEGRERRQGWLNSESKPLQSRTPQQEPGPISQREIGSQFRQLGEVTLRLALSLSAVLGVVLSLPSAGQKQGMEQEPCYAQQVQLARVDSTQKQEFHGRVGCQDRKRFLLLGQGCEHHFGCLLPALRVSSQAYPELQR